MAEQRGSAIKQLLPPAAQQLRVKVVLATQRRQALVASQRLYEEGFAAEELTDYYLTLDCMARWSHYYNYQRSHSAFQYLRPLDYYLGNRAARLAEREQKLARAVEERNTYWQTHDVKDKKLDPLARCKELKNAFARANWVVHTDGAKCGDKVCVLPSFCAQVPHRGELASEAERTNYSREYFFYYDLRNDSSKSPYRNVHVIGAAYATRPNDGQYAWSLEPERYSYTFVTSLGGANEIDAIKKNTIHEV